MERKHETFPVFVVQSVLVWKLDSFRSLSNKTTFFYY